MTRKMTAYVIGNVDGWKYSKTGESVRVKRKDLIKLNWHLKQAGLVTLDKDCRCIVKGCGMDMVFHLSYTIKCALYGYKKGINNQQYRMI